MNIPIKPPAIPSWDELFMRHVYLIASKSKDQRTRIGAVLVKNKRIISEGYNGIPERVNDDDPKRQIRPEKYFWMEHSEQNAILGCAKHGISSQDAKLYTQGIPCADCSRAIIQAGVSEIIVHTNWENQFNAPKWKESTLRSTEMLGEAGVLISYFDLNLNIEGFCDGRIIKV